MNISIIVAMTQHRVIGRDNKLPWHLSEDLKRFKTLTMGHPLIMGRKTYESIGKPLPGRTNIVLTRSSTPFHPGVKLATSFEDGLSLAQKEKTDEVFVIGGAKVFEMALPRAHQLYVTLIHKDFTGDVFFPSFDMEKDFEMVEERRNTSEKEGFDYTFVTATRKSE